MVTLFLRQGENGKQVLLSFPTTTPAEKEDVDRTLETLKSMSKTVTIQGAASEVMNLGLYLSGVDLAAEGEVERINQLAERLEHMSEVDCDKFAGMLDANSISGTKDILRLTEQLDDYVIAHFRVAFGNRIMKQLKIFVPVYMACGGDETEAVDYILATKVFRKFESLNLSLIRDEIRGLIDYLDKLFGKGKMKESIAFLLRLQKTY